MSISPPAPELASQPEAASQAALRDRAEAGDPASRLELGLALAMGSGGFPKDLGQAFHWLALAAQDGLPEAQYNLGVCYAQGLGTEKNSH
ncbi:MAG: hypothetical protein LBE01_06750, partial [Deltaproteobacteria bacterium]|nr:hypothetical protein [Deltaproteobacteria bacterium]